MKYIFSGIAVSILSFSSFANTLNFNHVEVGYLQTDFDISGFVEPKGFNLVASKQFENWYITGSYANQQDEMRETFTYGDYSETFTVDFDFSRYSFGGGYIYPINESTTLDFSAQLGQFKVKSSYNDMGSDSDTTDTFFTHAQIRHLLSDQFEVNALVGYERLHDDESENNFVYRVGAQYYFTNQFSVGLSYKDADEFNDIGISARYSF
ncbi:outer membrane protein [Pseudoalteromonas piratica]|uniref:Outer membrane protein beta-barrel domain-containing protein n=1 Tax=Pseudoalteromonas piratica TaxID=1348114 RepID=A0A0A7ELJ8_9GAMM|nr:DUF481 domain-containing protein [Pseudoalteromonas piratica]AIY67418.1 hypothetical protein OM33_20520 [Pseudoalteromonas piratica]